MTTTADPLALANREELDRLRTWLAGPMPELPPGLGGRVVESFAVSGSREWIEWRLVWNALYYVPPTATLLHGKAYGLDCLAQAYWRSQGSPVREFSATQRMWADLGKRAGIVRNEIMLGHMPDLVLAFIRDNSPGSSHAARHARELGIPTFIFRADREDPECASLSDPR